MAKSFTKGFGPARSFLLKEARGGVGGILRQSGGRIVCKAQGAGEGALTLLFADGSRSEFTLPLDGAEHAFDDGGRAVEGAYVTAEDGRAQFATDERARSACAQAIERAERERERRAARERASEKAPERAPERAPGKASEEKIREELEEKPQEKPEERASDGVETAIAGAESAAKAGEAARAGAGLPEGRWPPPPCMPGARYRDGRWTDAPLSASQEKTTRASPPADAGS